MTNENFERIAVSLNESSTHLQELRTKYDGAFARLEEKKTQSEAAVEAKKSEALAALEASKVELRTKLDECEDYITSLKNGTQTPLGMVSQLQEAKVYNIGDDDGDEFKDLDSALKFLSSKFGSYKNSSVTLNIKKNVTMTEGVYNFPFILRLIGQGAENSNTYKITFDNAINISFFLYAANLTYEFINQANISVNNGYFWINGNVANNVASEDNQEIYIIQTIGQGFANFQGCIFTGSKKNILLVEIGGAGIVTQSKSGDIKVAVKFGGQISLLWNTNSANISANIAKNTLTSSGVVYEN